MSPQLFSIHGGGGALLPQPPPWETPARRSLHANSTSRFGTRVRGLGGVMWKWLPSGRWQTDGPYTGHWYAVLRRHAVWRAGPTCWTTCFPSVPVARMASALLGLPGR